MIRNTSVLHLLMSVSVDVTVVKKLRNTHLEDMGLHISVEKNILLIIRATDAFLKNDQKFSPFNATSLYGLAPALFFEV